MFLVAIEKQIRFYCQATYTLKHKLEVPFRKMIRRKNGAGFYDLEILNIKLTYSEKLLAVLVGEKLPLEESRSHYLFLYQRNFDDTWSLSQKRKLPSQLK